MGFITAIVAAVISSKDSMYIRPVTAPPSECPEDLLLVYQAKTDMILMIYVLMIYGDSAELNFCRITECLKNIRQLPGYIVHPVT